MITRGTLIGEILDELANIIQKVEFRTGCQIYDLPVFAENFCRDILKHILGTEFRNLNKERVNNPGIDLGSKDKKYAVQITATSTSAKVNKTLSAITDDHRKIYKRFIILILSKKQSSYSAVDKSLAGKNNNFDVDKDIWDLRDLAKMAFDLEIDKLTALHKEIRNQTLKLQVDLEIRKKGGQFKLNDYDQWEAIPEPKVGTGKNFIKYVEEAHGTISIKERELIKKELQSFATRLARLPRITREFFVSLIERRDPQGSSLFPKYSNWETVLLSNLSRKYNGSDLEGELELLDHENFIDIRYPQESDDGPTAVGFKFSFESEDFHSYFLEYLEANDVSLRTAIGEIDLSKF